jgi:ABC-2 type transport system ATP-binding protein
VESGFGRMSKDMMTSANDAQALSLANVTKRFGDTVAVRGLTLDVRRGEMFGLIGPDGAGKTTTIRLLCGLLRADEGTIRVLGRDPVRQHVAITRSVGYFSQRFSLYGDLSIDENIAFFAQIHGLGRYEERRTRLLDMMQLTPFRGRLAERLSGGMKQKLALACTLIHESEVIFLDEPTTGVDPVSRREFWKLLSEFLAQGITVVMTTPYLDEAERCSRVALLHEGRLLALDTPGRLRAAYPGQVVEVLAEPRARAATILAAIGGGTDVQAFGERLHVRLSRTPGKQGRDTASGPDLPEQAAQEIRAALERAGVTVSSSRAVSPSLEDVFINQVVHAASAGQPATDDNA